ncbi:MAG: hypothetical protein K6C12_09805 [Oscillospiraceae bacterium]|nr:hypothetical protein [Oscillospiraceae bacterium]
MMLSKTERILALINFYLPHTDLCQYRYEADTIAQATRRNSSVSAIEKQVRRLFPEMEDDLAAAIAAGVKGAL